MRRSGLVWGGCIAFLIAAPGVGLAAGKSAAPLIVQVGKPVQGKVNGVSSQFEITPDGLTYPVLNSDTVKRVGLGATPLVGIEARIGSVKIPGRTGVTRFELGGAPFKARALWFARPIAPNADGRLGPGAVPQSVVTFVLRAPDAHEKLTSLPLVTQSNRTGLVVQVGGQDLFIGFSPDRSNSLATAGAGKRLADVYGGQLTGPEHQALIGLGVTRPVRDIRLSKPLMIGPLAINGFKTRIWDGGSLSGVADADIDPGEIVVTAQRPKIKPDYFLNLGSDALQACSSLTFDKARKIITLSCL